MIKPAMPKMPHDRTFYMLIGGNLVVLLLIGFLAVRPVLGMLNAHTTEITKTKAEVAAAETKAAELRKLKDTYAAAEQTYAPVIQGLPRTKDVAGYQTQLEELARLTTNRLTTVDTSGGAAKTGAAPAAAPAAPASQAGGFPTIPVKVELSGTYATVLDFVQRVESMDRFTKVSSMDLGGSDSSGALKATLELQTLYIPG